MVKAEPNNPDLVRDWGRMLLRDGSRPEEARRLAASAVWRKLVEARPDDATTAAQVADLFRQAGLVDDAIGLYRKAIALAPDSPQYLEYLGEYQHSLKRTYDALATWRGIAAGPRRDAASLRRLGEVPGRVRVQGRGRRPLRRGLRPRTRLVRPPAPPRRAPGRPRPASTPPRSGSSRPGGWPPTRNAARKSSTAGSPWTRRRAGSPPGSGPSARKPPGPGPATPRPGGVWPAMPRRRGSPSRRSPPPRRPSPLGPLPSPPGPRSPGSMRRRAGSATRPRRRASSPRSTAAPGPST